GMPVSEVMALYGQDGYRKLESQALQRVVATHDSVILAVAGGIVAEPMTYNALLSNFHTVWVKASPEEHMTRVQAQGDDRPMAGNPEAMQQLRDLLTSREPIYDRAETTLDTTGRTQDQSLHDLTGLIDAEGFLS
ncbi:MAG: shikimate kinase, partial [Marinomonas sp.]